MNYRIIASLVVLMLLAGVALAQENQPGEPRQGKTASMPKSPPKALRHELLPFGQNLFDGAFSAAYQQGLNPDYRITEGDRVALRLWGAKSFAETLTVDSQGNIFIPDVGPVPVLGVKNGELNSIVRSHVGRVYNGRIEVYTNLLEAQPIGVFVTGYVLRPGRYAGNMTDSVLYYLDAAGGITHERGSYRRVEVLRRGARIAAIDLYSFLLDGLMPPLQLEDGDTILVRERGPRIAIEGTVASAALYELTGLPAQGRVLMALARILPETSHVFMQGIRSGEPFATYIPIERFATVGLEDGDRVSFTADKQPDSITVSISGTHEGPSRMAVRKDATLKSLLEHIEVHPALANTDAVYLKRKSVAARQKEALDASLRQLEQAVLTADSSSREEAELRKRDAELILQFIERAKTVEPEGRVVVASQGRIKDIALEEKDEIIIPQKTQVVVVSGEVLMPQAIVYDPELSLENYIANAGGFTNRADKANILVIHPNGETETGSRVAIAPGDQVIVLAKIKTKSMQLAKDISTILYQIAVATRVAIGL